MGTSNLDNIQGIETELGFADITELLPTSRIKIYEYDVIRNIFIDRVKVEFRNTGEYAGKEVKIGEFYIREYGMRGRVFPLDEIIEENRKYDIIVQKVKVEHRFPPINIDAQIYHDFLRGEQIPIVVSRREGSKGNPSFKLFNYIAGFIKRYAILQ